jgi:hypothetical protein
MPTEADTSGEYAPPKRRASGWNDDRVNEQRVCTDGYIMGHLMTRGFGQT